MRTGSPRSGAGGIHMSERSEPQYLQTPDGTGAEAGLENRLSTGSDDSAGIATRILAGVLLALVYPWVITRRVVTGGIPRVVRMLRSGRAATSKAVGRGAHRLAAMFAFIGSGFAVAARPVAGLGRRCWHGISRGFRLIADVVSRSGRWVDSITIRLS